MRFSSAAYTIWDDKEFLSMQLEWKIICINVILKSRIYAYVVWNYIQWDVLGLDYNKESNGYG